MWLPTLIPVKSVCTVLFCTLGHELANFLQPCYLVMTAFLRQMASSSTQIPGKVLGQYSLMGSLSAKLTYNIIWLKGSNIDFMTVINMPLGMAMEKGFMVD